LSPLLGFLGYQLRKNTSESSAFLKFSAQSTNQLSLKDYPSILLAISTAALIGALIWVPTTYTQFYLQQIKGQAHATASFYTAFALLSHLILSPIGGLLSDKWGYKKMMFLGSIICIIFACPLYYCLANNQIIVAQLGFILLSCLFGGNIHAMLVELFPVDKRCTTASLCFMLGSSIGSITPFISVFLIKTFGNPIAPSFYMIFLALQWVFWARYLKQQHPLAKS